MNKFIAIAVLAAIALIGSSEAEQESRIFFRKPWIPLPPINTPPTNPAPTPTPTPATSCTVVEACTTCNSPADGKCDTAPGAKGPCYMDFCPIDTSGTTPFCARGCSV